MFWHIFISFLIVELTLTTSVSNNGYSIKRILNILKRRLGSEEPILGLPENPEDLPEAEPILPGHTLIRPSLGMLKSAVKFPQKDLANLVYGNLDNLGITYGKTKERFLYTGFRKSSDLVDAILKLITFNGNKKTNRNTQEYTLIAIPIRQGNLRKENTKNYEIFSDENKSSTEILTDTDSNEPSDEKIDYRRKSKNKKGDEFLGSQSSEEAATTSDDSSDYEKNPGNPYTVHKNRYKQNWMWNHVMTGDHMNVNPYAPKFQNYGPSGVDLLFGRKWWYFNQDDYKPFN